MAGSKQRKPTIQWERQPGWTDRLIAWGNFNPSEHLKLFSDLSQAVREEGRSKETNNQSRKTIYIALAQAIFLHDESIEIRATVCVNKIRRSLDLIQLPCRLRKKYRSELAVLTGTGAGQTYEELLETDSARNLIGAVKERFPWFDDLHGWWKSNPAYNLVYSNANPSQDFGGEA
ncbi:hypothetical protein OG21DRAFT_1425649, partial [Imleria badia]